MASYINERYTQEKEMSYNEMSIKDARVVCITPEMAAKMLEKQNGNRAVRTSVVKSYANDMACGAWKTTHQGIAFNANGELIDGQHRVAAIIMANKPINMLVTTYSECIGTISSPFDLHIKRSISDILGRQSFHMAVVAYIIKNLSLTRNAGRVESKTIQLLDALGDKYDWMTQNISGRNSRLYSAAPIRAACFVAYLAGYDWSEQYNHMANNHIKELDASSYMLYKKLAPMSGQTNCQIFRDVAFNASFAVATNMMETQKIFTNALFEKSRAKAKLVLKPYFN
jgi:hypothetical protein